MTTTERFDASAPMAELPDPNLHPPTVAASGDPFSALRVVHLLVRLAQGRAIPLAEIVARLNAEYPDWSFSKRVVADVIGQLRANWISDYRTVEALDVEETPSGPTLEIEDSPRARRWLIEQAWRFAAAAQEELAEFARGEGRATEG